MRSLLLALFLALPATAAPQLKDRSLDVSERSVKVGLRFYQPNLGWVRVVDHTETNWGRMWIYKRDPNDADWYAFTETIVKWLRERPENRRPGRE